MRLATTIGLALTALLLVRCSNDQFSTDATKLYAVSGTVDGLGDAKVTVVLNGATKTSFGDGRFTFPSALADGAGFAVAVEADPPGHMCAVAGGMGSIAGADATGVAIHCPSSDATLAALSTSAGPLLPAFDANNQMYAAGPIRSSAIFGSAATTVTAAAHDPGAQIVIANVAAASGVESAAIPLKPGPNPIDITVTAADKKTQKHYTVVVTVGISGFPSDYLKASNTRPAAFFGAAVSVSGDTLAVASYGETSAATGVNGIEADGSLGSAGAVYVFTRTGGVWSQQAYLKASNTRASAIFGISVALAGDTLAVGSYGESSNAIGVNCTPSPACQNDSSLVSAGAVYVFTRTGGAWSQQAYIKASNTRASAFFGASVAVSADTLAVGSFGESSAATGVNMSQADGAVNYGGAVYVFTRAGGTWSQQAYVKASNTHAQAAFGYSVALAGDTLAVGAYGEASNATGVNCTPAATCQADASAIASGAAYVFTRTAGVWSQQAYVKASNTQAQASFGISVALAGDTLAVGSNIESSKATGVNGNQMDTSSVQAGAVYVFTRVAAAWSQQAYVKASNTRAGALFGGSVALAGDTLAVGSVGENSSATGVNGDQTDTAASGAGAVYIFTRTGVAWSQHAYVKASNTSPSTTSAHFGKSVALSSDTLAAGSEGEGSNATGVNGNQMDVSAPSSGATYVFR